MGPSRTEIRSGSINLAREDEAREVMRELGSAPGKGGALGAASGGAGIEDEAREEVGSEGAARGGAMWMDMEGGRLAVHGGPALAAVWAVWEVWELWGPSGNGGSTAGVIPESGTGAELCW